LHDIGERLVRSAQDRFEVLKDLLCLSDDAALDQLARGRILCDLAAGVHTIAVANGRRKWTDWFGDTVRRNGFRRHVQRAWEVVDIDRHYLSACMGETRVARLA